MKKLSIIIALIVMTFVSTSCDNYLNRVPLDKNSDATNWTSEASLENFAWSFYSNFSAYGSGWSRGQYMSTGMSDNYCIDGYDQPTQNIPSESSAWNDRYEEIRKANTLLNRIKIVPNLSEEATKHWEGVGRFYRALKHFELVRIYGDIVWVETEIDIDDNATLGQARTSRVEVMKKVCEDLEYAGENCRYTDNNTINNMVAWALLSRVALFEAAWQKYHNNNSADATYFYTIAKEAANNVISSGKYAIHNDYVKNYISKSLVGNSEMILFKVYSNTAEGDKVSLSHAMQGWSGSSSKSWSLTKSAVESFANVDGLPIHMSGFSDATLESAILNRDARLALIVDPEVLCPVGYAYKEGINSASGYYTDKFVDWNDYGTVTWLAPNNTTDGPIYTYSEVLLNYAEAAAELEDLGGAAMSQSDLDKSVNELRVKHGNLPALSYAGKGMVSVNGTAITKDPKNPGVSELLWEIRRERRSELMCDGFRFFDLMRWKLGSLVDFSKNPDGYKGASLEAIKAYYDQTQADGDILYKDLTYEQILESNFISPDGKYISGYDVVKNNRVFDESKHYLEPIPSGEILLNPNLTQNPGW